MLSFVKAVSISFAIDQTVFVVSLFIIIHFDIFFDWSVVTFKYWGLENALCAAWIISSTIRDISRRRATGKIKDVRTLQKLGS